MNWHSGKPITRPVSDREVVNNSINYGPINNEKLNDYMRMDVSTIYQFKLKRTKEINVGVSIWNLFDTENTINQFYRINTQGVAAEVQQNALGITPNAVIRMYL
jgi:hypothetical protein